jgi:hypothetical protein
MKSLPDYYFDERVKAGAKPISASTPARGENVPRAKHRQPAHLSDSLFQNPGRLFSTSAMNFRIASSV